MTDREKMIKQFKLAEKMYNKNVASFDIEHLESIENEDKQLFVKEMLETIEGLIKALVIWKGKTWDDAKTLGHKLAKLYDVLDDEGKQILGDAFLQKPQPTPKAMLHDVKENVFIGNGIYGMPKSFESLTLEEVEKMMANVKPIERTPHIQEIGYDNRQYDGVQNFPGRRSKTPVTQTSLMQLLSKLNMPPMRYGNFEFNLTDEEIRLLYDFTAHLNTLALIARGRNMDGTETEPERLTR